MAKKPAQVKKTTKPTAAKTTKNKFYMSKRATILVGVVLFISVTAASYFGYKKWEKDNLIANAAFTVLAGNSADGLKVCKVLKSGGLYDVVWVIDKRTPGNVYWGAAGISGNFQPGVWATAYGAQYVYGGRMYNASGSSYVSGRLVRQNDNYNMSGQKQIWNILNC